MASGFLKNLLDTNSKELRRLEKQVAAVNALEPEIQALSDDKLKNKTNEFRRRLHQGETLDPVSYTHLDVYKRQPPRRRTGR